jgi:hypothetical protein
MASAKYPMRIERNWRPEVLPSLSIYSDLTNIFCASELNSPFRIIRDKSRKPNL